MNFFGLEKVQSPSDLASKLNHDLTSISDWAKRWLVTMNYQLFFPQKEVSFCTPVDFEQ